MISQSLVSFTAPEKRIRRCFKTLSSRKHPSGVMKIAVIFCLVVWIVCATGEDNEEETSKFFFNFYVIH